MDQSRLYKNALENARYLDRVENKGTSFRDTADSLKKVIHGPKYKAPIEAAKLAFKLRQTVKKHEDSPWIIAFVMAISCDYIDTIPIAGWIISWFFRPFLFIFLFGKGTWKVKLVYYIILFLDFIPIISMLPLGTTCVFYAWYKSKEKHDEGKDGLKALSSGDYKKMPRFKQ